MHERHCNGDRLRAETDLRDQIANTWWLCKLKAWCDNQSPKPTLGCLSRWEWHSLESKTQQERNPKAWRWMGFRARSVPHPWMAREDKANLHTKKRQSPGESRAGARLPGCESSFWHLKALWQRASKLIYVKYCLTHRKNSGSVSY